MNALLAIQHLHEKALPLIIYFPFFEEDKHVIQGKGLCFIQKIHGDSRITIGKFYPSGLLTSIRKISSLNATFEIGGKNYSCSINDLTFGRDILTAEIPETVHPTSRKYLRVNPSLNAPVILYFKQHGEGTTAVAIHDISERGIGFTYPSDLNFQDKVISSALELPLEGRSIMLTDIALISKIDMASKATALQKRLFLNNGIFYGIEIFPQTEDEKKIRLYIMQREVTIRRIIQAKG
jgi:hypothetical protein